MTHFIRALIEVSKKAPIWFFMAHQETVAKYRRTTLGPWWITLGTGAGLCAMGFIWGAVFKMDISELFPYLTSGFIFWAFISSTLIEGGEVFAKASVTLRSVKLPPLIFIFASVLKNLYILAHNIIIFLLVLVIFQLKVSFITFLFVPGLLLLVVTSLFVTVILSILGARFRDLSYMIGSLMTFMFLLTPVMWNPNILSGRSMCLAYLNPITHYLAIVRDPLLNKIPDSISYLSAIGMSIFLFLLASFLYKKSEKRIIFWV
jgi:ABC-type polysaccharide/polyol phosphate export permease